MLPCLMEVLESFREVSGSMCASAGVQTDSHSDSDIATLEQAGAGCQSRVAIERVGQRQCKAVLSCRNKWSRAE